MSDDSKALDVLRRNLAQAEQDRQFHLMRGARGNVELAIAGFTIAIIKRLIREIKDAK